MSSSNTDTSFKSGIIAFILIAIGYKVRFDTLSVDVSYESKNTFTGNTIIGRILGAGLTMS